MAFLHKPFLFLGACCIFCSTLTQAQTPALSPVQTKRLADAGKLYGYVKYFHPWLQYKTINWDSAFAAAVPAIINAPDKAAYTAALQQWLGVLNDPATTVIPTPDNISGSTSNPSPQVTLKDSIVIVSVRNLKDLDNYMAAITALGEISKLLPQARYLVFDLRPIQAYPTIGFNSLLEYANVENALFAGTVYRPSARTVVHDGFAPERGSTSGGYSTFFRVEQVNALTGTQKTPIPVAFLLNPNMPVPPIAVAMQDAGKALIISEGPLNVGYDGVKTQYTISDDVAISLRTGEPVRSNGQAAIFPNATFEPSNDPQVNLNKAIALLRSGIPTPVIPSSFLPVISARKNTSFTGDKVYPDLGYRVLAAAKMYAVINTFFVNKKLMDKRWNDIYTQYLPQFVAAKDSLEYNQAVAGMYAHIQDGHGFISTRVSALQAFVGQGVSPAVFGKVIDNKFVITAIIVDSVAKKEGLNVGDIIKTINGKDVIQLINQQRPFTPASNFVTQTRYISDFVLCGNDSSTATLQIIDRNNQTKEVVIHRRRAFNGPYWKKRRKENDGPVFKMLPNNIGYVDMERLPQNMVDSMLETFKNTRGIIMDIRGYPQGTAWTLAPRLSATPVTEGALFTRLQPGAPDISAEGNEISSTTTTVTFMQKLPTTTSWRYKGKTVMLMNETTQSQAEHSGLFYKAANGTTFIGSQTAGANGDVTNFFIPGLINLTFSGQNVSYPNGQTMQRKGLIPDITVKPTINGIRAGKDEVLDRAILFLNTGK